MKGHRYYDPQSQSLDVTAPALVEITVRADRKVVWINIDGQLALRACRIENLTIEDVGDEADD